MSLWQETEEQATHTSSTMTDIVFRISCEQLPVDHATALANSIIEIIPTLGDSPKAGVHQIHVAGSQNGWERPADADQPLWLSKRTRLRLRAAKADAAHFIDTLSGASLDVAGFPLHIKSGQLRTLDAAETLFSRYTCYREVDSVENEGEFVDSIVQACNTLDYKPNKILCGKVQKVATEHGGRIDPQCIDRRYTSTDFNLTAGTWTR